MLLKVAVWGFDKDKLVVLKGGSETRGWKMKSLRLCEEKKKSAEAAAKKKRKTAKVTRRLSHHRCLAASHDLLIECQTHLTPVWLWLRSHWCWRATQLLHSPDFLLNYIYKPNQNLKVAFSPKKIVRLKSNTICFPKTVFCHVLWLGSISVGIIRRKCKCSFLFTTHKFMKLHPMHAKEKIKEV